MDAQYARLMMMLEFLGANVFVIVPTPAEALKLGYDAKNEHPIKLVAFDTEFVNKLELFSSDDNFETENSNPVSFYKEVPVNEHYFDLAVERAKIDVEVVCKEDELDPDEIFSDIENEIRKQNESEG